VADKGADQPEYQRGQPGLPALEVLERVVRDEQAGDGTRHDAENERTDHAFLLLADGLSARVLTRPSPTCYVSESLLSASAGAALPGRLQVPGGGGDGQDLVPVGGQHETGGDGGLEGGGEPGQVVVPAARVALGHAPLGQGEGRAEQERERL